MVLVRYPAALRLILLAVVVLGFLLAVTAGQDLVREHLRALVWSGLERPRPTGPLAVGYQTISVPGDASIADFTADLVYPVDADAPQTVTAVPRWVSQPTRAPMAWAAPLAAQRPTYPLILYIPSGSSTRNESSFTLAALASHGFVVAAMDDIRHIPLKAGGDAEAQRAGFDFTSEETFARSRLLAARRMVLEARAGALVIDAVGRSSLWAPHVDTNRIGVLGFSFGGGAAAALSRLDPRVRAVVNMDGSLFGGAARLGVDVPYLVLFSDSPFHPDDDFVQPDLAARFDAILDREEVERQFRDAGRAGHWTYVVAETRHEDFSDRLIVPALTDRRPINATHRSKTWLALTSALTSFFDTGLRGSQTDRFDGGTLFEGFQTLSEAEAVSMSRVRPR